MNWKKMAEAFGRATFGRNDKENPAIKMARDSFKRDLTNYKDKDANERAESFFKGEEEGWLDRFKNGDTFEDEASDARLKEAFDKAFDDIAEDRGYKNWVSNKDKIPANDGLDGEINNLEREGAVDDVRAQMIEDLKNGMDISDVFEKYGK